MNQVSLLGRMTRDPELRYSSGGKALLRFTIAVDRSLSKDKKAEAEQKGQPTADFIGCVCFGKQGETIEKYFKKGSQIAISGRIQTGSYENSNKQRIYTTDVLVEKFYFVESAGGGNNQGQQRQQSNQGGWGYGHDQYPIQDNIPF